MAVAAVEVAVAAAVEVAVAAAGGGGGGSNSHNGGGFQGGGYHGGSKGGSKGGSYKPPNYKGTKSKRQNHQDYDRWQKRGDYYGRWSSSGSDRDDMGGLVNSLPKGCSKVVKNGAAYKRCGSSWYKPRYQGSNLVYMRVKQP